MAFGTVAAPGAAAAAAETTAAATAAPATGTTAAEATTTAARYPTPCPHPRLLLRSDEESTIRAAIGTDPLMKDAYLSIKEYSDKLLGVPPCERVVTGRRLLSVSREVLRRVFWLATVHKIEGSGEYASRAIEEMLAVAAYKDWNPSHFLDVAEMTAAMALGYDWLYGQMTPPQRDSVRNAIIGKGLSMAQMPQYNAFYRMASNWNQVCNAGMAMGALAVWEDNVEQSSELLDKCLETNGKSLERYSPEGAYPEGYSYWEYGSSFQMLLISSLESAFGSDLGLMEGHDRFFKSGTFMMMMGTPSHHVFNYFDCGGRNKSFMFPLAWMAWKTGDAELLYPEIQLCRKRGSSHLSSDRLFPMFLIYGSRLLNDADGASGTAAVAAGSARSASGTSAVAAGSARSASGSAAVAAGSASSASGYAAVAAGSARSASGTSAVAAGTSHSASGSISSLADVPVPDRNYYVCSGLEPLFIFRSGWTGEDDTYFAVKGGCATDSHGHVDAGSFIFESDGVGWALDLGMQDYHQLESRGVDLWNIRPGSQRWDVFRISEYSHNVMTVNGSRADVNFRASFSKVWQKRSRKGVEIPMTGFYGGQLDSALRTVWLDRKDDLHVKEEFVGGDSTRVLRWVFCTEAECRILGPSLIELRKDGKVRHLRISTRHYASPRVYEAKGSHDYDAPNPGLSLVGFEIKRVLPHEKVTLHFTLARP